MRSRRKHERLTEEKAARGVQPRPFSKEEWQQLNNAVNMYSANELNDKLRYLDAILSDAEA